MFYMMDNLASTKINKLVKGSSTRMLDGYSYMYVTSSFSRLELYFHI